MPYRPGTPDPYRSWDALEDALLRISDDEWVAETSLPGRTGDLAFDDMMIRFIAETEGG